MENDAQDSIEGLHSARSFTDDSSGACLLDEHFEPIKSPAENRTYDSGSAADFNESLWKQNNPEPVELQPDRQSYDSGAAADFNADLSRLWVNGVDASNTSRSSTIPTTSVWSTSNATTSISEAATYITFNINPGFDPCDTKRYPSLQCDLVTSTGNLMADGDTDEGTVETSETTPLVNHGPQSGHSSPALPPSYGFSGPLSSTESKKTSAKVRMERPEATF
ncbi:hypothetical protein sscle_03g030890 [Sclerotinia sclerotiorum 1980 UF-70]|uniref:Uncharacterized protein n=1 Tax=Sclerotinia sclerotiorum (strain ATCC 18683 / 1980 / Ss-1) TaxID=665079 RepID=A0A1D9Q0D5_SCLS1|nr:hypothetical protein sscle_03g030890 [Sclerotinia sclerotiorum 1980 UF-70]